MFEHRILTSVLSTLGVCAMTSSIIVPSVEGAPRWEDQTVFRVNKEEPHATKMPFPTAEEASTKTRMESPYAMLLNGEWKYHWSPTVEEHATAANNFFSPGFDDSAWGTIPVPSNVELQGHGTPIYVNSGYPFVKNPPSVTDEPPADWTVYKERSPVSAYRRTFSLPDSWENREIFIVFNGVDSCLTLYVNGQEVGYSQDSRTPAEFNITKYLKDGENLLAVEVHRWSDGSYLEDQDMWRLSGIFRDVYLWSAGQVELRDIEIHAALDESYEKGVLDLKTWVYNFSTNTLQYTLAASLVDGQGNTIAESKKDGNVFKNTDHVGNRQFDGLDIQPWSAESPTLYTLQLALMDGEGKAIAHYAFPVGFKTSEIKDGNLLINGKPVLIKGVNRHDHDEVTGHYVSEDTMRAELDLMKRLNINAIRTSHYPNDPRFLELVNEYGFYVISEANIETHGFGNTAENAIANAPEWRLAMADRVKNMVETFKNQPCIIVWSLGNEAGTGPNFQYLAGLVDGRDPSRPVHYEGACRAEPAYGYVAYESPMYYGIGGLDEWLKAMKRKRPEQQKPMIQCEYSHAMGNSCGGLAEYWDYFRREPLLQGGFIWDWRDQGILQTQKADPRAPAAPTAFDKDRYVAEDGSLKYFAFGGDFGDKPNDNNFCMNGVVGADLVPNPHATEVAYQYRSILTSGVDLTNAQPVVKIFNEHFFTTLKDLPMTWILLKNGEPVKGGKTTVSELAPQSSIDMSIPISGIQIDPDAEYHLNVEYALGQDAGWADKDFVIARDQLELKWSKSGPKPYVSTKSSVMPARSLTDSYVFSAGNISAAINKQTAQLVSYKLGKVEFLKAPLQLNFWRAPIDNDRGNKMPETCGAWKDAGANVEVINVSEQKLDGGAYELAFDLKVPVGDTTAKLTYTFYGDGVMGVGLKLNPAGETVPKYIPRVGFQCSINSALSEWNWFGRGPVENYSDRKSGAFVGLYKGDVRNLWSPYARPQENSNRTDVRQASFMRGTHGLLIRPTDGQLLQIAAYPFLMEDLENSLHAVDLPLRDLITVQISHSLMGVGGEDSWRAWPRPGHLPLTDHPYEFSFILKPF